MIYLILSIVVSTCLTLYFKVFAKYKINIFQALVFNYITAASIGFYTSPTSPSNILHQPWLPAAILLGVLLICIFYSFSIATVRVGVSAATVANKMSVIIPVMVAFYLYGDLVTLQKIAGFILALSAVYMASKKKVTEETQSNRMQLLLLPAIVFVGSGIIDVLINYTQVNFLKGQNNELFLAVAFGVAFIVGSIITIIQLITKKTKLELKNIVGGVALGIPNFFSISVIIKALDSKVFESSVFYPINNTGIVVLSAIAAYLFFKEKLSPINIMGIVCAVVSIALISYT